MRSRVASNKYPLGTSHSRNLLPTPLAGSISPQAILTLSLQQHQGKALNPPRTPPHRRLNHQHNGSTRGDEGVVLDEAHQWPGKGFGNPPRRGTALRSHNHPRRVDILAQRFCRCLHRPRANRGRVLQGAGAYVWGNCPLFPELVSFPELDAQVSKDSRGCAR